MESQGFLNGEDILIKVFFSFWKYNKIALLAIT